MNSYMNQSSWVELQNLLPSRLQFTKNYQPQEEYWNWNGNIIHLDTFRNSEAPAKIILFHGVGTNGRQMSMILGGPLARSGFETIAIDMPTYGMTEVTQKKAVTYDDWVQAGADFVESEKAKDNRPIFLYGLSAGGMETYHVAAKNKGVAGIIGMTFLDQRNQDVRDETAHNFFMSRVGISMASFSNKIGLSNLKIPMSVASKMSALCNSAEAMKIFMKDKSSAANKASMAFLDTYGNYTPDMEAEDFDVCPILLTQPSDDKWTPLHLSTPFLNKISKVPVTIKKLDHGGHYPIEEPALTQLLEYTIQFINNLS